MLEDFIKANNLKAEILSAESQKTDAESTIKPLLFISPEKEPVLVIILAGRKIDEKKLCSTAETSSLRIAEPIEALEITGYAMDVMPPISIYGVQAVIDKEVMEKEFVFAPAGKQGLVLKISPKEILACNEGAKVEKICL